MAFLHVGFALCWTAASAGGAHLESARRAEASGDKIKAYILYQRAAAERPGDPLIWAKLRSLRGSVMPAITLAPEAAPAIDLPGMSGSIDPKDLQLEEPASLRPPHGGPRTYHLKDEPRKLYERIAADFGLIAIFDRDYMTQAAEQPVRFDIDHADYRGVLYALGSATNTFATPISDRIFLVAQDTIQRRQEYEQTVARVFPIPQRTSVQEAQELMQAIQQTLEIRRIVVDAQKRQILMRDRRNKVELAALLLEEMANYKPQVGIEMELLTVGSTLSRNLGASLPTSSAIVNFGKLAENLRWSTASSFTNFLTFGGGATFLGLGLGNARLIADYTRGESQSVLRSSVVASDGQAATMHIGDKYPIVTSQFVGATPGPGERTVAPPPVFNFEELGLVLKVTPFVHGPDEATLEIEAEFKVLGGGGFNGIPIINTRKFQSKVRLSTAEWAVVAGLVTESDARTLTGMAGLASIPILGPALRVNGKEVQKSEALLLLKPRILSMPPSERVTRPHWVGSETRPLSPL